MFSDPFDAILSAVEDDEKKICPDCDSEHYALDFRLSALKDDELCPQCISDEEARLTCADGSCKL